jgi:hypothetical protein
VGNPPAQRRWSLRFVEPEVEARYLAERAPWARRRLRSILPALLAIWFGAIWFDLTAPAEMGARNMVYRFAVGGPMFVALTGLPTGRATPTSRGAGTGC